MAFHETRKNTVSRLSLIELYLRRLRAYMQMVYYFGIADYKHKRDEFLRQFTWLNYARLHLDRSYYYTPKGPLFLNRYVILAFLLKLGLLLNKQCYRNLRIGTSEKDRLAYVVKNLNSEAKFDFNHHGFTGYLVARDFVQYRGPKRRSTKPRKQLEQICSTLHENNALKADRMQQ